MRTQLLTVTLLILAAMIVFPALSVAQTPKYIYGFDREFPPYSFETNGEPAGFDVELLRAVLRGQDVELVFKPMKWERVQLELSAGDIHMTSGMARTQQRMKLYNFNDQPTLPLRVKMFTKNENRTGNVTQLRGQTVAVEKGSLYQRVLEEFGGMNIKLYDSDLEGIKALRSSQVAAYCGPGKTTYYYLEKLNYKNISAVGTPLAVTNMFFAVNKDFPDLLQLLNEGMRRVRDNGEYDAIFRRWFVPELDKDEQQQLVLAAAKAAVNAYAPYSQQPMGGAVLTRAGNLYTGCNIENGEYNISVSALAVAIQNAVSSGDPELRAAVSVRGDGSIAWPTAMERRMLFEFGRGVLVLTEPDPGRRVVRMITDLLPFPYELEVDIYETF